MEDKNKDLLDEQRALEWKYTLKVMQLMVSGLGMLIFAAVVVFFYGLFGTNLRQMLDFPEPVSREVAQQRLQERQLAIANDPERVEDGIHVMTGLKVAEGWEVVRGTCTACHSAALVTQNRATREGWASMIDWMQETQGLWDLGEQEPIILDYLAANYAPEAAGRRPNLDVEAIEWYVLKLD